MSAPGRAPHGSPVVLGADAGGSHTTVAVGRRDGTVLARADGPGAAMRPGGAAASAVIVLDTARRAAAQAGVELPADAAVVGAAGAGREPERRQLEEALVAIGAARLVRVYADAEIALRAAFGDGPGVLLSAGTGSVAFARDPAGALHRSGGYGWQLGDEGGGYWLGRRALAAAARAHDGREAQSTLAARLLAALGLREFDDLVRWAAAATPAQVAALAPLVLQAARDGEEIARAAVAEAGRELAALVVTLAARFPTGAPVPVALTGGLLGPEGPLTAAVAGALAEALPRARLERGPVDAPGAALALARRLGEGG